MTYPHEETYEESYEESVDYDSPDTGEVSGPGQYPAPWEWSATSLLWVAGAVLAAGFGIWFLMSFSAAKVRALTAEVAGDGE